MIPPTPGADPASRLFGYATPPDGAGPIGPDQLWPTAIPVTREEFLRGLNPLQHVPVLGTIYRKMTGEEIPATMRVLGAGIVGGPAGMLMSGFFGIIEAMFNMKPDLSRPCAPAGMAATGSEAGMQPVTPGTLEGTSYTTLATVAPEWLTNSPTQLAGEPGRGQATYQSAAMEYQRAQMLEEGVGVTVGRVGADGVLHHAGERYRAALGTGGIRGDKREGDGATPAGLLPLRRVLYRAGRMPRPRAAVPIALLDPADGWCDDPGDAAYNRMVRLPYPARHEALWREDAIYDLIGVLGWNDERVERGRGSAIFLHVARADWAPTEGCIALAAKDLVAVLAAGLSGIEVSG